MTSRRSDDVLVSEVGIRHLLSEVATLTGIGEIDVELMSREGSTFVEDLNIDLKDLDIIRESSIPRATHLRRLSLIQVQIPITTLTALTMLPGIDSPAALTLNITNHSFAPIRRTNPTVTTRTGEVV